MYAENIKYREKIKRQQQLDQEMREKDLRMQENLKQWNIEFTRQPRKPAMKKARYYSESETECEPEGDYNYAYNESDGKPLKMKTNKKKKQT